MATGEKGTKASDRGDTPDGMTPRDAARGQFVYTLTHEMGHVLFDILDIPILGAPEDAADDFAAYMMLQLGKGTVTPAHAGGGL
jgi:Putative metallopeptidase